MTNVRELLPSLRGLGMESSPDQYHGQWSPWRQLDKQTSHVWRLGLPLIWPLDHADKASAGSPIGQK